MPILGTQNTVAISKTYPFLSSNPKVCVHISRVMFSWHIMASHCIVSPFQKEKIKCNNNFEYNFVKGKILIILNPN